MTHATGTFELASWNEEPYAEIDGGGKLSRATVKQVFSGDIEGDGSVEWLMCYREDQTADFVGLVRVAGQVGGRSGDFVLRSVGTYDGELAKGEWSVVPGSGTRDLRGLRGTGGFSAPHGSRAETTLEYDFE
jgi:Protein of unknown function (DUF3224)